MDKKDINQFKTELADLLRKYDVSIGFMFDGDTHGICNERIVVEANKKKGNKEIFSIHDTWLDYWELNNLKI